MVLTEQSSVSAATLAGDSPEVIVGAGQAECPRCCFKYSVHNSSAQTDFAAAFPGVEQHVKAIMESKLQPLCSSFPSRLHLALPDVVGNFRVVINNNKSVQSIRAGYFLPPLG